MHRYHSKFALIAVLALVLSLFGTVYAEEPGKVNINTANAEQLLELKGVGDAYATKIVEFRELNGPFTSPEDIMKVTGIGQKTYDLNKDRITVK
jgi:competence protein ComEA